MFSFHVTGGSFRFDVEGAGVLLIAGAKFRFEKVGGQNICYRKYSERAFFKTRLVILCFLFFVFEKTTIQRIVSRQD